MIAAEATEYLSMRILFLAKHMRVLALITASFSTRMLGIENVPFDRLRAHSDRRAHRAFALRCPAFKYKRQQFIPACGFWPHAGFAVRTGWRRRWVARAVAHVPKEAALPVVAAVVLVAL